MKKLYLTIGFSLLSSSVFAQSAIDAMRFSQPDLRGTARSLAMGGAFGALGGDLSAISGNPAGIGVYRSSEIGMTMDLDIRNSSVMSDGLKSKTSSNSFSFDNIGGVATIRLYDSMLQNLNIGFSFNKVASFDKKFKGVVGNLSNSVSNYIAGISNNTGLTVGDVTATNTYDPYNPTDGGIAADWLSIMGYNAWAVTPVGDQDQPDWKGMFGSGTTGMGSLNVDQRGGIYEYNIALGGNISDVVYVGMNFDIVSLDYQLNTSWAESLTDAYVFDLSSNSIVRNNASLRLRNQYSATGSGFNYQLGLILKPIHEFRFGIAFHTPTWYNINERFTAEMQSEYANATHRADANNGRIGDNSYNFSNPWKIITSAATVLNGNFILSGDLEFNFYKGMKFSEPNYADDLYDYDYGYGWDYSSQPYSTRSFMDDPYGATNNDINNYFKTAMSLRVGAEYRLTRNFSLRAGYSFVGSPVEKNAAENKDLIYTAGTIPSYTFDKNTNYVTAGIGYRNDGFYVDMAYVYKNMKSTYHAYTPDPEVPSIPCPQANLSFNNSRIVLSTGIKF